jgi:hypothetical protein
MKTKDVVWISLTVLSLFASTSATHAGAGGPHAEQDSPETLVETVRRVT